MIRSTVLGLLGLFLLGSGSCGCAAKALESSVPTAHGYTVSLDVSEQRLWLGPRSLGDLRPNMAELLVEVRDSQGQRIDGVAVEFSAAPSWVNSVNITPQRTLTQAGTARALIDPQLTGVIPVMAHVDGQTLKTRIFVETRNFGGSSS